MGLDFYNSSAHWTYGGFHDFRKALAREIGINLDEMDGFGPPGKTWTGINDPIVALLNHSDCGGELSAEECRGVAPRLRELVADWPQDEGSDRNWDRAEALQLADDMEICAEKGESLIFC